MILLPIIIIIVIIVGYWIIGYCYCCHYNWPSRIFANSLGTFPTKIKLFKLSQSVAHSQLTAPTPATEYIFVETDWLNGEHLQV